MRGMKAKISFPVASILVFGLSLGGCRIIPENPAAAPPPPPVQYPPEIPSGTHEAERRAAPPPVAQRAPDTLLPPQQAAPQPTPPPVPRSGELPPRRQLSGPPIAYTRIGETRSVDGPKITPLTILEDSRCPSGTQCVSAGRVVVRVRVDLGSRSETRDIALGQRLQVADGTLELVDVAPERTAGEVPAPFAYQFGFRFMGGI